MTYQEIIKQTETLNQGDFLNYVFKLQEIAKQKYSLDIFLQNFTNLEKTEAKKKKYRKLGFLQGVAYHIADDFDAPLDDLNDYM